MERCSCARGEQGGVASAWVGGAVDYAWYLRPSEGSGAHGAWLYGDVESAVGEVFPAEMSGCACYGLHFGVGGYVAESFGEVVCACYYCVIVCYDGAYWYFSFLCGLDGFGYSLSHESLVALRGCLVEHVACVFNYYIGVVMRRSVSATFSMSHRGVDVAPHMPMDGTDFSHAGSMSSGPEMKWDAGFTSRHCSKRAFPLLLLRPDTKRMRLWDAANARMRGRRPATRRHIVSKYRNWPEVLRRCISWMTCWKPERLLVVWEYRSMSRERSTRSRSEVP